MAPNTFKLIYGTLGNMYATEYGIVGIDKLFTGQHTHKKRKEIGLIRCDGQKLLRLHFKLLHLFFYTYICLT